MNPPGSSTGPTVPYWDPRFIYLPPVRQFGNSPCYTCEISLTPDDPEGQLDQSDEDRTVLPFQTLQEHCEELQPLLTIGELRTQIDGSLKAAAARLWVLLQSNLRPYGVSDDLYTNTIHATIQDLIDRIPGRDQMYGDIQQNDIARTSLILTAKGSFARFALSRYSQNFLVESATLAWDGSGSIKPRRGPERTALWHKNLFWSSVRLKSGELRTLTKQSRMNIHPHPGSPVSRVGAPGFTGTYPYKAMRLRRETFSKEHGKVELQHVLRRQLTETAELLWTENHELLSLYGIDQERFGTAIETAMKDVLSPSRMPRPVACTDTSEAAVFLDRNGPHAYFVVSGPGGQGGCFGRASLWSEPTTYSTDRIEYRNIPWDAEVDALRGL